MTTIDEVVGVKYDHLMSHKGQKFFSYLSGLNDEYFALTLLMQEDGFLSISLDDFDQLYLRIDSLNLTMERLLCGFVDFRHEVANNTKYLGVELNLLRN